MNKYKTCEGCPDRSISPNCHMDCDGYRYRQNRHQAINLEKAQEVEIKSFKIACAIRSKKLSER